MATSHASPSTSSSNSNDFEQTRIKLQTALLQSTNIARLIPPPNELRYSRTLSRPLGKKVDQASKRLLHITSRVLDLAKQAESGKGKQVDRSSAADLQQEDVVDAYQSKIVQVTDQLLEQIDKNLDEAFDSSKKNASKSNQQPIAGTSKSSSSKDPSQSTTYRDAGDIRKPQLDFNEGYDTSRTAVFTPLLPNKPHAIEPLDFTPTEYESETLGKTRMRIPNPYAKEIQAALEKPFPNLDNPYMDKTAEKMSSQMDDKPYLYVDTPEKLAQCLSVLKDAQVIAVDLEHHDLQSYRGITCLIQVSTITHDFIIDPLVPDVRSSLHTLNEVFASPDIVKVLHGADWDIIWLQRDFGLYIVNLFDTYHASRAINRTTGHSLASLLKEYTTFLPEKKYQLADWRIRPLTDPLIHYARSDTHFLIYIFFAILGNSGMTPQVLQSVREQSAKTASQVYEHSSYDFEGGRGSGGWRHLADRNGKLQIWGIEEFFSRKKDASSASDVASASSEAKQMEPWHPSKWLDKDGRKKFEIFRGLHEWRDRLARQEDVSTGVILTNKNLMTVAERMPDNIPDLAFCLGPDFKGALARRGPEILNVMAESRARAQKYLEEQEKKRHLSENASRPPSSPQPTALASLWNAAAAAAPEGLLRVVEPIKYSVSRSLSGKRKGGRRRFTTDASTFFGPEESELSSSAEAGLFEDAVKKVHQALLAQLHPASSNLLTGASSRTHTEEPVKVEPEPTMRPLKVENEEDLSEIIHVKTHKRDKGKKRKSPENGNVMQASSASTSASPAPASVKQEKKPAYVKPFDYTNVKSVLDEPMEELQPRKRPKKGRGGDQQGATGASSAEGPTFKRPPKSMNQPKSGNKSHTFL